MRAAYVTALGGPELITIGELPVPTPFPFVVGRDLVGTVCSVGPGMAKRT